MKLFISYRRRSSDFTHRLRDDLAKLLDSEIFVDLDSMDETDFESSILRNLRESQVFLLIVTEHTFVDRIHKDDDWVRREIKSALDANMPIVLACQNGLNPSDFDIPDDIAAIARKQGINFYPDYYRSAVERLAEFIARATPIQLRPQPLAELTVEKTDRRLDSRAALDDLLDSMDARNPDRVMFIIDSMRASSYAPLMLDLDDEYDKAATLKAAMDAYGEIAAMARRPNLRERARSAWVRFRVRYPDYTDDPADLATLFPEPVAPPPPAVGTGRAPSANAPTIPLLDWIDIPAGDFTMGSDKSRDPQAYDDETPQHNETVAAFKIAKYSVTYAQYELFVAGDGYRERAYWTAAGWDWRGDKTEPEAYWNDPDWHKDDHPVVGVTWYESFAFCNWLTSQLYPDAWQEYLRYRASVPLHTITNLIRLPTEPEWEKAARWDAKRQIALIYPYGDTYDPKKANTTDSGIGHTTPVTAYPNGASPYGVFDMSGNVWEWCLTKWRGDYTAEADNNPDGTDVRVIRGGSWDNVTQYTRAACRFNWFPDDWNDDLGFRVARS